MCTDIDDVAVDLLELASYVYAADQAISRGREDELDYGDKWRRQMRFEVPVRRPDIWGASKVRGILRRTLGFLSDDDYEFVFRQYHRPPSFTRYLFKQDASAAAGDLEEVILLSGGLDSLAGAVSESLIGKRRVAFVSHRPAPHVYARQKRIIAALADRMPKAARPLHVAVEVNKGKLVGRDFTQRTRSFLFAAFAAIVARLAGRQRIRFYENGVVSLNLPYSPQVLGARATRTTHPRVLAGFAKLFECVFGTRFVVDNLFLWQTKPQILREVKGSGCGQLCALTCSCARTFGQQAERPHCGRCSQCVDRRLSALAAELDATEDPPEHYVRNVLTDSLERRDALLSERYIGMLLEVGQISDARSFLIKFPETARALRHTGESVEEAANRAFELYQAHAKSVRSVLARAIAESASDRLWRDYPSDCLLRIAAPGCDLRDSDAKLGKTNEVTAGSLLILDDSRFAARFGRTWIFLGNTLEYRLLKRLSRRTECYLSYQTLASEVWGDDRANANSIQRVASTLRRLLREAGLSQIVIDGSQQGHLRLVVMV
jgi:hypothetical protein